MAADSRGEIAASTSRNSLSPSCGAPQRVENGARIMLGPIGGARPLSRHAAVGHRPVAVVGAKRRAGVRRRKASTAGDESDAKLEPRARASLRPRRSSARVGARASRPSGGAGVRAGRGRVIMRWQGIASGLLFGPQKSLGHGSLPKSRLDHPNPPMTPDSTVTSLRAHSSKLRLHQDCCHDQAEEQRRESQQQPAAGNHNRERRDNGPGRAAPNVHRVSQCQGGQERHRARTERGERMPSAVRERQDESDGGEERERQGRER